MYVVGPWLVDTSSSSMIWILVYCALELLEELVNVQEVALCPKVGQWQRIWVHGRMGCLCNHRPSSTMAIIRHTAAAITGDDRELDALETHKSLADIVVSGRVKGSALGIAKELIQRIICSTLTDLIGVIVELSIVNWTIC